MKKKLLFTITLFAMFFGAVAVCVALSENDAKQIRDSVLRFHVVANSNSDTDQQNKLAVRDGLADFCAELFEYAPDKAAAMTLADDCSDSIAAAAENILKENGSYDSVAVTVRKRFFPTRKYDGVSLPAGVYDTIDVLIGDAAGKNFWCVMFPDICLTSSAALENKDKMSDVLTGSALQMATDSNTPAVKFKFKTVEIFETLKNFLFRK